MNDVNCEINFVNEIEEFEADIEIGFEKWDIITLIIKGAGTKTTVAIRDRMMATRPPAVGRLSEQLSLEGYVVPQPGNALVSEPDNWPANYVNEEIFDTDFDENYYKYTEVSRLLVIKP